MKNKSYDIVIVGGGASGLYLAERLSGLSLNILLVERKKSLARKFVVAGKGGLNITNNLPVNEFIKKYEPNIELFKHSLSLLNREKLIKWYESNGGVVINGSNKKVILEKPRAFEFVKTLEEKINSKIDVLKEHKLIDFAEDILILENKGRKVDIKYKYLVLALGGASWGITGSDGSWDKLLESKGLKVNKFKPSNCELLIDLSERFFNENEGKHIKNIELSYGNNSVRGELFITSKGIIGGPVYHLIKEIRGDIDKKIVKLSLDFKPDLSENKLKQLIANKGPKITWSNFLKRKLKLPDIIYGVLKYELNFSEFNDSEKLAKILKHCKLRIKGFGDIDKAISTSGGIDLSEINNDFNFKKFPYVYAIGEMLDWDAPTGGFLLHGCMSQAETVYKSLLKRLKV